ncbi:hypothetical protein PTKIN_Ptkin15bG0119900 [Pterospermum kingtungense]
MLKARLLTVKNEEAFGLFEALGWICNLGYCKVIFELDSKLVVDAIWSLIADITEFGAITKSCKQVLALEEEFCSSHVKRRVNEITHSLARAAVSYDCICDLVEPCCFYSSPSS